MNLRKLLLSSFIIILIYFLFIFNIESCKHTSDNPEVVEPIVNVDPDSLVLIDSTKWVQKPQIDIPWPGLADSPWPMYLHDPQHTGRSKFKGPSEGKEKWRCDVGGMIWTEPVIGKEGDIYVSSQTGYFYSISKNGQINWKKYMGSTSRDYACCPIVDRNGTIYSSFVGSEIVFAMKSNGDIIWKKNVGTIWAGGRAPNLSYDGTVLYVIADTSIVALKTADGEVIWKYKSRQPLWHSPSIYTNGNLFFANHGSLIALDKNGNKLWEYKTIYQHQYMTTPAMDNDGNIYITDYSFIYSISQEGVLRWKKRLFSQCFEGDLAPSVTIGYDGTIFIRTQNFSDWYTLYQYALDYNGQLKWKYTLPPQGFQTTNTQIVDIEGNIYLGLGRYKGEEVVNFVSLNKYGKERYTIGIIDNNFVISDIDISPVLDNDGTIYIGCDKPYGRYLFAIK